MGGVQLPAAIHFPFRMGLRVLGGRKAEGEVQ